MKKWIVLTLALALALSLFAGCGKGADADETDYASMSIEELKPLLKTVTDGKLTVATSPDFAPYEFYSIDENENPTLAGFDIALAQYIADYLGNLPDDSISGFENYTNDEIDAVVKHLEEIGVLNIAHSKAYSYCGIGDAKGHADYDEHYLSRAFISEENFKKFKASLK